MPLEERAFECKIGTIGALYGEVFHNGRFTLQEVGISRHQEIDYDVDVRATVIGLHCADELEATQISSLLVAMRPERVDKLGVLAVTYRFRVEREIHVPRTNMGISASVSKSCGTTPPTTANLP